MKKLLSVVLAAIMTVSVFALSVIPAMAEDVTVNSPTASTAVSKKPTLMVNGTVTVTDITYSADRGTITSVTFTYVGEGTLTGWEHNLEELGLLDGSDYTVTYNEDGSLTIDFISEEANEEWDDGEVVVNALVDFGEGTTAVTSVTTKKNDSSKAPATGMSASLAAGSVAVVCAGIAVLTAAKKKDAE